MPDHLKPHEILHEREQHHEKDRLVERIMEGDKDDEDHDESVNGGTKWWCLQRKKKKNNKKKNQTSSRDDKAKQLLLPLAKFEQLRNGAGKKARAKKTPPPPPPPPHPYSYACDDDPDLIAAGGCYPCFIPRRVPRGHPPSPPPGPVGLSSTAKPPGSSSSSASYHDFLKTLIENNDFYSDDCNVHRNVQRPAGDRGARN